MLRRVVWKKLTDVSEATTASIKGIFIIVDVRTWKITSKRICLNNKWIIFSTYKMILNKNKNLPLRQTLYFVIYALDFLSGLQLFVSDVSAGGCSENRSGCDHVCEEVAGKPICSCYQGFSLRGVGTCVGEIHVYNVQCWIRIIQQTCFMHNLCTSVRRVLLETEGSTLNS